MNSKSVFIIVILVFFGVDYYAQKKSKEITTLPPKINVKPSNIKITHNNTDGTFTVIGTNPDGSLVKLKAYLEIIQPTKRVKHNFTGNVCPNHEDFKTLTGVLKDQVGLTVNVIATNLTGKELKRMIFNDLDLIVTANDKCGFIDTK